MLMLVEGMNKAFYSPRVYVAAETDKMSAKRALSREQSWTGSQVSTPQGPVLFDVTAMISWHNSSNGFLQQNRYSQ
jgi:hypothetical protein